LDWDGIARPGTKLHGEDIIVAKSDFTTPTGNRATGVKRDTSLKLKNVSNAIVDDVIMTRNEENHLTVKMRVRQERIPEMGDKFASRHGQKGTIGITLRQEDMPFTKDGIIPDIVINPHAIPSRMTIGHLIETITGKSALLEGQMVDATPFEPFSLDKFRESLKKHGFNENGTEEMYSGKTGELLTAKIFIGPCNYQRLKHMVADKIHSRSHGPLQVLTHQPVEGRAREGGLRTGEMEAAAIVGHGGSAFLRDRLFQCSDPFTVPVCTLCGLIAINEVITSTTTSGGANLTNVQSSSNDRQRRCLQCGEDARVEIVEIPYAARLFFAELQTLCLVPRIRVD
jgi:DNA-directed RNA polymerase II subunit RPB2